MKKQLLNKLLAFTIAIISLQNASAQDNWSNVASEGIDNYYNSSTRSLHAFNGYIYTGTGTYSGIVYRSSTGNPGSWNPVFNMPFNYSVNDINSTTLGGGTIYASGDGGCCDSSQVFSSNDGVVWSPYFRSPSGRAIKFIVPFKGGGANDSIYLMDNSPSGSLILKSFYNSNDPDNLAGDWDTVFNFSSTILAGARVTSTTVHNGKLYIGTNYGATIWSSSNGNTWVQNDSVGSGFGNMYNNSFTALASYGGYLYVGTANNTNGPQIWRSNDDMTWTMVQQYSTSYDKVASLSVADGKLWVVLEANSGSAKILKTVDGTTYITSTNTGFGESGISGNESHIVQFGNNVYYGGENYFMGGAIAGSSGESREIGPNGAQIWRLCTVAPPPVNIGSDQTVCPGIAVTFDAGAGAQQYNWSTGDTTQTVTVTTPGLVSVSIIGANGCSGSDNAMLINNPTPNITPPNVPPALCSGSTITLMPGFNSSNVYIADPPMHFTGNDSISDQLPAVLDSISVSGVTGSPLASTSLMSVTIDSLTHTYDGDVEIGIYAPDGSYINLSQGRGGSSDNFIGTEFIMNATQPIGSGTGPFTGSYLPDDNFSFLTGGPNGTWVLKVGDYVGGDNGNLKGWSIRFKVDDTVMTYSWTPTTGLTTPGALITDATPLVATTYTLTATNSIGCSSLIPVSINVPGFIMPDADTVCYASSLALNISGASANTTWAPATGLDVTVGPNVVASPTSSIHYYLTDTVSGCPLYDSIFIYANGQMFNTAPAPASICYADTASMTSNASGGSGPYTYSWDMGGVYLYGQTINEPFTSGTSFTITATDAAGCTATDFTNVSVSPSTDIYGQVTYSGGPVASSNIVIYRYEPYLTHFDTIQTTTTDAAGNYHFVAINHFDYLIEVFPNATYTTLVPSYYGDVFLWDSATVVNHDCNSNDTLNIVAVEEAVLGGPGSLGGVIREDDGFNRAPGDPVPGIDVKLGRNPGGQMVTNTQTDGSGQYHFTGIPLNIPGQWYTVYVDIPGLGRDSSYSVVLDAATSNYDSLNYYVDSNSVFIIPPGVTTHVTIDHAASTNTMNVYPNPSQGNSVIEYSINADAEVSLGVYNVLGVKVVDLENKTQMTGTYKYALNAKDHHLNSGVYFITLITNGKTSIKRLVITE